ncbi:MAG: glycosyltransferase family A protein [Candidatus Andersenbacteria bacterium]
MSVRATVLIPTFDHGATLRYSVASVLQQTVADIEVLIVGDGMPPQAAAAAREVAASDGRVQLFEFAKGPRHGEIHRHEVLQHARGPIVCYHSDDNLMLPTHVERMEQLLEQADLAHAPLLMVAPDATITPVVCDLQLPFYRSHILTSTNRVSLSSMAHTLAAYRRLPHGWRTTPPGTPTDQYMLQQFLAEPWVRAVSGTTPTTLHFGSPERTNLTHEQRLEELARWSARLRDPEFPHELAARAFAALLQQAAVLEAHHVTDHQLTQAQLRATQQFGREAEQLFRQSQRDGRALAAALAALERELARRIRSRSRLAQRLLQVRLVRSAVDQLRSWR